MTDERAGRPAPRKRSTAARRAKKVQDRPDGLADARRANEALEDKLAAQGPLPVGRAEPLVYSSVSPPRPKKDTSRTRAVRLTTEPIMEEPVAKGRKVSQAERLRRRAIWTKEDGRRLLAEEYSLEQVEFMTGYTAAELGR